MFKGTAALILITIFVEYDCSKECQKCETTEDTTSCRYGGKVIADRDDECPAGKSTCYRMTYMLKCNRKKVYKRGCDNAGFCRAQRARTDIDVDICDECDYADYCNTATLF